MQSIGVILKVLLWLYFLRTTDYCLKVQVKRIEYLKVKSFWINKCFYNDCWMKLYIRLNKNNSLLWICIVRICSSMSSVISCDAQKADIIRMSSCKRSNDTICPRVHLQLFVKLWNVTHKFRTISFHLSFFDEVNTEFILWEFEFNIILDFF